MEDADFEECVEEIEKTAAYLKGYADAEEKYRDKIKKLEEKNQKHIVQLTDEQYRNLVENIRKETKKEFEQKVKDKIEELANTKGDFATYIATSERIKALAELLEDK